MTKSTVLYAEDDSSATKLLFYDTDIIGGSDDDYVGAEVVMRTTPYTWEIRNVSSSTAASGLIEWAESTSYYMGESAYCEFGYFFQNSLYILTQNTTNLEWCYDAATETIYMYSTAGDPYNLTGDIQVSIIDTLIDLNGGQTPTIKDLQLEYANHYGIYGSTNNNKTIDSCDFTRCVMGIFEERCLPVYRCDYKQQYIYLLRQ